MVLSHISLKVTNILKLINQILLQKLLLLDRQALVNMGGFTQFSGGLPDSFMCQALTMEINDNGLVEVLIQ